MYDPIQLTDKDLSKSVISFSDLSFDTSVSAQCPHLGYQILNRLLEKKEVDMKGFKVIWVKVGELTIRNWLNYKDRSNGPIEVVLEKVSKGVNQTYLSRSISF